MRAIILAIAAIGGLILAPVAMAAPFCLGDACNAIAPIAISPEIRNLILGASILFAFLLLLALLPDFDGTEDGDWGDDDFGL